MDEGFWRPFLRNVNFDNLFGADLGDFVGRDLSEAENLALDEPLYFKVSLKTPRERLEELEEKRIGMLVNSIGPAVVGKRLIKNTNTAASALRLINKFHTFTSRFVTPIVAVAEKGAKFHPYVLAASLGIRFVENEITLFRWTKAEADAILADTADPVLPLSSNGDEPGRPELKDRHLFMIKKPLSEMREVKLTICSGTSGSGVPIQPTHSTASCAVIPGVKFPVSHGSPNAI